MSNSLSELITLTAMSRRWLKKSPILLLAFFWPVAPAVAADDVLPSWNDGPAKSAIIAFVQATTDKSSPQFVPPAERIATFDQDGTLWVEHPMYTQVLYCLDRVPAVAKAKPELAAVEPFKTVLSGNHEAIAKLSMDDLFKILAATLTGMSVEEFRIESKKWLDTAKHPRWKRPYTELTYLPMQELLKYLRDNGYETWIVTGGGIEFVRAFAAETYGIPRWQVVGSSINNKFKLVDGKAQLERLPEIDFIDDGPGKAIGINSHIGLRPIAAFGNSDGDIEMLEYADSGKDAHFEMMVHHDDAKREYSDNR
ncbi:MAG: HAD family hydrolase [Desulfobacterales bacterium]